MTRRLWPLLVFLATALPAFAHIGSKDVFEEVSAGPYRFYVTIRPPNVIPGVAAIEVKSSGAAVESLRITPTPLTGEAALHPPSSDAMKRSTEDPSFFTGSLWIMASGSWQVHLDADGPAGKASTAVPVPAVARTILPMQRSLGSLLALLGVVLVVGMVGIVAAAVGQSRTEPGTATNATQRRKGLIAGATAFAVTLMMVYGGYKWWNVAATAYADAIYRPLSLTPSLTGDTLDLKIGRHVTDARHPFTARSNADLLPDHGHIMHLYAIRQPGMDAAFHLHPKLIAPGELQIELPAMPAGHYMLYADVVHANGFPETLSAKLSVPEGMKGGPLAAEDASAAPPALSTQELGNKYSLPDGYSMEWEKPADLTANTPYAFRFRLLDRAGKPATDAHPYLGMAGHAAFVKTDGSVFAHTHPEGSAAMQAMMLAGNGMGGSMDMSHDAGMSHDAMSHGAAQNETIPADVEFPYGFPSAGRYRIFIQMKHANTVETGVFDASVR